MSRTSRVPYHQNVYDLLGIEPGVCPDAARMIAAHEAAHGPIPASVREWCTLPDVVRSRCDSFDTPGLAAILDKLTEPIDDEPDTFSLGSYWYAVNDAVPDEVWVRVLLDGADDPLTLACGEYGDWACPYTFTQHVWCVGRAEYNRAGLNLARSLWLRAPAEPFAPPIIDFLTEQFGAPELTPRDGEVTTHTWRPDGGVIRVTADHPSHPKPLSAWWVHATTPEQLAEFARLLLPWGTLAQTLHAGTDPAREAWTRVSSNTVDE